MIQQLNPLDRKLNELAEELSTEYGVRAETIASDLSKPASRSRIPGRST